MGSGNESCHEGEVAGHRRGLLERKVGVSQDPFPRSWGAARRYCLNPLAYLLACTRSCVCLCSFLGVEATLLVGVCVYARMCVGGCQWLGLNSVIPAAVGDASCGGRSGWRAGERGRLARAACAGTENIRRRPGRAALQQCRPGRCARGGSERIPAPQPLALR